MKRILERGMKTNFSPIGKGTGVGDIRGKCIPRGRLRLPKEGGSLRQRISKEI